MAKRIQNISKLDKTGKRVLELLQNEAWEYIQGLFMGVHEKTGTTTEAEIVAHKDFAELVLMQKLSIDCNGDIYIGTEGNKKKVRDYIKENGYCDPWGKENDDIPDDYG